MILLQGGVLAVLLFIISAVDIKKRVILEALCVLVGLTAIISFEPLNLLGIFSALPFLIAALTCKKIGGGDIKLMAASGIVIGFWGGIFAMVIGLWAMIVYYGVLWCITKLIGKNCPKSFPLAPFLTIGILTVYYIKSGGICIWGF